MFLEKNFIASAVGLRTISATFDISQATEDENGKMYIAAGTYYENGGSSSSGTGEGNTLSGITLDNVYFKDGEETAIGALIVAGHIFKDRLPVELSDDVIYELGSQGLFFENAPVTVINGETGDTVEQQENDDNTPVSDEPGVI